MKHLKLFLALSIISLMGCWSLAVINANGTQPLVNPDGSSEIVGVFNLFFNGKDFQDPGNANTNFYVIVRVQFGDQVKLRKIGARVSSEITCAQPIFIAWEADFGTPSISMDPGAVRIVRMYEGATNIPAYFDLLFTKNMFTWALINNTNSAKITIGTPFSETPAKPWGPASANMIQGTQEDTRLCCDFSTSTQDFRNEDWWRVGMITKNSDVNCNLLTTYNASYNPTNPSLAQRGTGTTCDLIPLWPCGKYDECNPVRPNCNEPAEWNSVCPEPGTGQNPEDPCDEENETYMAYLDFAMNNPYNIFSIREHCADGSFNFEAHGKIVITLNPLVVDGCDLGLTFTEGYGNASRAKAWIGGDILTSPREIWHSYIDVTPDTVTIEIPAHLGSWTFNSEREDPYCISVLLPHIMYDACCMLTVPEDECKDITVNIDYEPPSYVCGVKPATYPNWKVGCLYGCIAITPEPIAYPLVLYFTYLPAPAALAGWQGGIAITNYADQATEAGVFYLWNENGDPFSVDIPPLGGHSIWTINIADLPALGTPLGAYTDWDKPMSGIAFVYALLIADNTDWINSPYPPKWWYYHNDDDTSIWTAEYVYMLGAAAGIDGMVIVSNDLSGSAYGYQARHLDNPLGNGPIWQKKGQK